MFAFIDNNKYKKFSAFTMAEAVLVMTILGIIATVMITTMKPDKFKKRGYDVLAKSVYGNIDTAVTHILVEKTRYNNLSYIYKRGSSTETFSMCNSNKGSDFADLLKDYMATKRGDFLELCGSDITAWQGFVALKNGACIKVKSGSVDVWSWIPGETEKTAAQTYPCGMIWFDINGREEPNKDGIDRFIIPLNQNGIVSDD